MTTNRSGLRRTHSCCPMRRAEALLPLHPLPPLPNLRHRLRVGGVLGVESIAVGESGHLVDGDDRRELTELTHPLAGRGTRPPGRVILVQPERVPMVFGAGGPGGVEERVLEPLL